MTSQTYASINNYSALDGQNNQKTPDWGEPNSSNQQWAASNEPAPPAPHAQQGEGKDTFDDF